VELQKQTANIFGHRTDIEKIQMVGFFERSVVFYDFTVWLLDDLSNYELISEAFLSHRLEEVLPPDKTFSQNHLDIY